MRRLLLVTSNTCPPCKRLKRLFWDAEIVPHAGGNAEHIPVEGNFTRVRELQVKHSPCILLEQDGETKAVFYGENHPSARELLSWLDGGDGT